MSKSIVTLQDAQNVVTSFNTDGQINIVDIAIENERLIFRITSECCDYYCSLTIVKNKIVLWNGYWVAEITCDNLEMLNDHLEEVLNRD